MLSGLPIVLLALGLPLLADQPGPSLDSQEVVGVAAGVLVAFVLSAIMGAAIGALARNQVAGVMTVLLVNVVVNPPVVGRTTSSSSVRQATGPRRSNAPDGCDPTSS